MARSALWNLAGTGLPALVAIVTVPFVIKGLGVPRFGVLTIIWALVGYLTVFDFGLGAALTRMVAERLGAEKQRDIPPLFWTALGLMFLFALLGSAVLVVANPWLVHRILKLPADLRQETLVSFYLLAACLPVIITTTGLRGTLEAQQLFNVVNAIRIPMSIFVFAAPLLVLPFSRSLVPMVAVLTAGRILAWFLYFFWCLKSIPGLRHRLIVQRELARYVIRFGGWMTISNVISPVMVYMDRLVIASVISISAVAYYATPFEVVSKLLVIPAALGGVMFPAFTVSFVRDRQHMAVLLIRGCKYISLAVFPFVLVLVTMASHGLRIWLGSDFAAMSTAVLRWLAAGIFISSLAQLPWGLIQAAGRPDLTAKIHMLELLLYVPALWVLVSQYGIQGAAVAWTARVALDAVLLLVTAQRLLPARVRFLRRFLPPIGVGLTVLFLATLPATFFTRVVFDLAVLLALFGFGWVFFVAHEERQALRVALEPVRRAFYRTQEV